MTAPPDQPAPRPRLVPSGDLLVAVELLGDLIDWFGAPDWDGPALPMDVGRRINDLLQRTTDNQFWKERK